VLKLSNLSDNSRSAEHEHAAALRLRPDAIFQNAMQDWNPRKKRSYRCRSGDADDVAPARARGMV